MCGAGGGGGGGGGGGVNLENCEYLFLQKSQQCPCVLLLKRILNVYYHTLDES